MTFEDIGLRIVGIRTIPAKVRRQPSVNEQIQILRSEGKTMTAIGAELGMTRQAVAQRMARMGI